MDAGLFGSIATVLFFVVFIGIVWWAYHGENKRKFEDAANLPFEEDAAESKQAGQAPHQ